MKTGFLKASLGLASVILLFAFGTASAADKWNLLAEKVIKSTDPSAEIQGQEGKTFKEDVERTKLLVEGAAADHERRLPLEGWQDETVSNVGVVKAGGETAAKDAPAREAVLMSVSIQYKILNNKPTATVKVWGYD